MANRADKVRDESRNIFSDALEGAIQGATTAALGPLGILGVAGRGLQQAGVDSPMLRQTAEALPEGTPAVARGAIESGAAALDAFETAQRGLNTALAGTQLAAGDYLLSPLALAAEEVTGTERQYANPLYRDGFEVQDVIDTYAQVWNNEVTPGQAIATTVGRRILNTVDLVVPGDMQAEIDKKVIEDSKAALRDPKNTRGLTSWMTGLHSEFDIYDERQADSAYNQGLGRWITGLSDAAVMWWAAPDVLAAKGAGFAGRQLFTRALDDLGDVDRMAQSLAQHAAAKGDAGSATYIDRFGVEQTVNAKKTDVGRLVDSLTKLNREQIYRHALAQDSSDATLVANVFGDITDYNEAALALRAMAGDMRAADELFTTGKEVSKVAADALRLNSERAVRLRRDMEQLGRFDAMGPAITNQIQRKSDELDQVLKEAIETNDELKALDSAVRGLNPEAGIPNQVRFGSLRLSRFESGPNSPARLEFKAKKASERAAGNYLWQSTLFKSGGKFGRSIRYIHSAGNYMRTKRMNGAVRLADTSDDLIDEMDSLFSTVPMFRRLARLNPETAYMPTSREVEEGVDQITASQFRRYWVNEALNARTATERYVVKERFEQQVLREMEREYGLSSETSLEIVSKYKRLKEGFEQQLKDRGFFSNDEEIVVAPEMQSMLAEGAIFTTDFNFLETIFRLDGNMGATGGTRPFKRVALSADRGMIAGFDAIWRPLVLMRLGYTQRNVAEGWLRELAAFGSVGYFKERSMGTTAADITGAAAVGYRAKQLVNATTRPFRFYNRRQIKNLLQDLRDRQGTIADERKALDKNADELAKLDEEIAKKEAKAEKNARKQLVDEARDRQEQAAGTVWEDITDLAFGNVEYKLRTADEIVIPVSKLRPLWNVNSRKRANVASGFPDEETAGIQQALTDDEFVSPLESIAGDSVDPTDVQLKEHLTPDERALYDSIKYGQTADELEQFYNLQFLAQQRVTMKALRRGSYVARRKGNNTYELIHNPDEVRLDDVIEGRLSVLAKENFPDVTHVRAKTYGETVDLRTNDQPLVDGGRLDQFDGDFFDFPEELIPEAQQLVLELNETLGVPISGSFMKVLDDFDRILKLAESDSQIADGLRVRAMAQKLPPTFRQWMEDNKVLIPLKKIRQAEKASRKSFEAAAEASNEYRLAWIDLKAKLDDPEYVASLPEIQFIGDDVAFHGGARIQGDQLSDTPPMTQANVDNLHGVGFYTTRDNSVGAEYLLGKAVTENEIDNPSFYAIEVDPSMNRRFLDLDAPMFNDPNFSPDELQQIEQEFMELVEDVISRVDDELEFEDVYDDILERVRVNYEAQVNPIDPTKTPRTTGENLGDYRQGLEEFLTDYLTDGAEDLAEDALLQVRYDAQMAIVEALQDQGALGMRHIGGRIMGDKEHEVFIWFSPPNMVRVDEVSDEAVRIASLQNRWKRLKETSDVNRGTYQSLNRFQPYRQTRLDAAHMSGWEQGLMGRMMTELGVGRILVDDVNSPNGYRIMVRPDMMSVGVDSLDAVPPGALAQKDYIDQLVPQEVRSVASSNPAVFTPSGMTDEEILAQIGDQGVLAYLRGKSKGTPQAKAAVARWMETRTPDGGYTHVQIGGANSDRFVSASEMIGGKKTGTAYGALLDADEVSQTKAMILRSDDEFVSLDQNRQSKIQAIEGGQAALLRQEEELKSTIASLQKRLKRDSKKGSQSNTVGTGMERFRNQFGDDLEVEGVLNENNQGGLYADLSGSERRNNLEMYGFSDRNVRDLKKTTEITEYKPGSELYFDRLAEQLNRYYRNDPVAMAMLRNPELAIDDNSFAEWLPGFLDELTQTQRGRAWLRDIADVDEFKGLVDKEILRDDAFDDAYARITEIRDELNRMIPVKGRSGEIYSQVWRDIADGDVNPNWLRGEIGWRSDLGNFKDYAYALNDQKWWRRTTGKIMRNLGTLPENHLVRHPFFRARWREEMQRQVDLYAEQLAGRGDWDGSFSQAQINAMNNVARKWALKQTNETLYTIQRISTPAHMFRFVAPFFPAWASTMRFWLLRMPVEKPENVIRYSYLFNAPEAIGAVEDRDGNKVAPAGNFLDRIGSKFTGVDDNSIVIQMTPSVADKMSAMTGGNGTLRISKGSLDMMLQGEHFWLPGLGPLMQIPASAIASMKPDWAEAIRTGNVSNGNFPAVDSFVKNSGILSAMTRAAYESVLPFGPSKEKSISDVAIESVLPAWIDKSSKALGLRGDSAQFSNAAVSIYRDRIVEWELGGRQGPAPRFDDAVGDASKFFWWRAAMNLTLPFAPGFASENEFYAQEWRRIERETFDNGGTYQDAQDQFLTNYGPEYFAFTQSLSGGSSGMSSTVGEFQEFESNPKLYADLANIGEDASFMTMASRPFDTAYNENGFDPSVYAWQFNRKIEGAPGKFFRTGSNQRRDMLLDVDEELGWYNYNKYMDQLTPLFEAGEISEDVYNETKRGIVTMLGKKHKAWFDAFNDIGGNRSIQSARAMDLILGNEDWMKRHGDTGYAQGMQYFKENRDGLIQILLARKALGGSSNLDAKANQDIAIVYEEIKRRAAGLDSTGELSRMIDRFFGSDRLEAIPGKDK